MLHLLFHEPLDQPLLNDCKVALGRYFEKRGIGSFLNVVISYEQGFKKSPNPQHHTMKGKSSLEDIFALLNRLCRESKNSITTLEVGLITLNADHGMPVEILDETQKAVRELEIKVTDGIIQLIPNTVSTAFGYMHIQDQGQHKTPIGYHIVLLIFALASGVYFYLQ